MNGECRRRVIVTNLQNIGLQSLIDDTLYAFDAYFNPNAKLDSGIRSDSGVSPASLATQSTGLGRFHDNKQY